MMEQVQIVTRSQKPARPRIRAHAFFAQALPLALSSQPADALPRASIGFDLTGSLGGRFTVHVDQRRVVFWLDRADVVIRMSVGSFEGMLRGAVDVLAAARVGALHVEGDRSALKALAVLLAAHRGER